MTTEAEHEAFTERFFLGATRLMDQLDAPLRDELLLLSQIDPPSARPFEERVDVIVAGRTIGSLRVEWLRSGEGPWRA